MATCPRCRGHLTDSHRCPRRPAKVALEVAVVGVLGALAGTLLNGWLDPSGHARLELVALVGGALVAIGINRAVRG